MDECPKKNEIMPFATTWMNLEIIRLNEASQRQISLRYHFHGGFKKKRQQYKWIYIRNRNRSKDMENKPMVAKRGGVEDKLGAGD